MAENTPDVSIESVLRQLTEQARVRWGAEYVEKNQDSLQQAAEQLTKVSNNLPDTETEPGFYQ
jgi:hypothetical protein